jgi:hypothetical protein
MTINKNIMLLRKVVNINRKVYGFSILELILVLPLIIGLILITNTMLTQLAIHKKNNQIADQIKADQKAALMYLTDNYRNIMQEMSNGQNYLVIPAVGSSGYLYHGQTPELALGQIPCLYITRDVNNQNLDAAIKAYLLFGNSQVNAAALNLKEATAIAHLLNGNAGVMVPEGNSFKVIGLNFDPMLRISYDLDIGKQCGFSGGGGISGIQDNSIIVDLTQDRNFFAQIVNISSSNKQNEIPPRNPSLQKTGDVDAVAMRTNLYLDNVISESSTKQETYCSAAGIALDPNSFCLDFARVHGYELVPGSCSWDNSVMQDNGKCLSSAKGDYIQKIMGCQNSNFGDASLACNLIVENERLVSDTARWTNIRLENNQCYADAVANYQAQTCDFKCTETLFKIYYCNAEISALCTNKGAGNLPFPKVDQNGYIHGQLQANGCYMEVACRSAFSGDNIATGFVTPIASGANIPLMCKTVVASLSPDSINQLGYIVGGFAITEALPRNIEIPAVHRYRKLRLGNGAPNGTAITTSRLDINHAGIQTGMIGLDSHSVSSASACNSTELGKIIQQHSGNNNYIQAQYRCTYSKIACSSGTYCYLPVKSASNKYLFKNLQHLATCPDNLVVDPNQPKENIDINVKCPNLSNQGYSLDTDVHGEMVNCYNSLAANISFCPSYQTLCTYKDHNGTLISYSIDALKGLLCMVKSNTFVIDNYIPNQ